MRVRSARLLLATPTALLMLVFMAGVAASQDLKQAPKGDLERDSRSPAARADRAAISAWVGKYPLWAPGIGYDLVGHLTFFETPEVKTLIAAVLDPYTISQMQYMSATGPIQQQGDWLIAHGCDIHRCDEGNWIVAINFTNFETLACVEPVDSPTARVGASGKQYLDLPRGRPNLLHTDNHIGGYAEVCPGGREIFSEFNRIFGTTYAAISPSTPPTRDATSATSSAGLSSIRVPLKKEGGTFVVPVLINDVIELDFTVDSGADHVSVPADVFSTLRRKGAIKDSDIIGKETYAMADGSTAQMASFMIKSLKVGNIVVENVRGSVAPIQGSLLLGQTFLERFKSWSIDNTKKELLLEPQ
jgi:clan AA aspartic protease (TIGR02281 family)